MHHCHIFNYCREIVSLLQKEITLWVKGWELLVINYSLINYSVLYLIMDNFYFLFDCWLCGIQIAWQTTTFMKPEHLQSCHV